MSHRWDCPMDWEAEREGRRAGEDGYRSRYSNPYADECHEAEEAWDRGFRRGEFYREEQAAEEAAAVRAAARRREAAAEEEYYSIQQSEAAYYGEMEREYYAQIEMEHYAQIECENQAANIVRAIECSEVLQ